jgi:hypothetical protein
MWIKGFKRVTELSELSYQQQNHSTEFDTRMAPTLARLSWRRPLAAITILPEGSTDQGRFTRNKK